jgi:gamma-glutamylcyclotransferase
MSTVKPTRSFTYFAYGSNMLTRRLTAEDRAPSAKRVATGYVVGRRLTFDKVSQDASGKCDAEHTDVTTDRVYGVVFEIAESERQALGVAEGLNKGYEEKMVNVVTQSGVAAHMAYIATKKEPTLRPYRWYKALTIAGAVEHDLPKDYIEWIRTIEAVEDPKAERRDKNEALLLAS